jgi:hypothetical protein
VEILLLKVFCAPALVVASSLAGRRWGASVTGVLVALPIVAGPILLVTYLQHGPSFAATAAGSSLLGLVALALFAVVFARASRTLGWVMSLVAGWAATLAADTCLSRVHVCSSIALALMVSATMVAMKLMPRATVAVNQPAGTRWPRWDLPGRAAATSALVVAVTTASSALGPQWTGVLAPFPIATSVIATFVLVQQGTASTAATLSGVLTGLFGFATFCYSVAVLVRLLGGITFAIAAGLAVAAQLLVRTLRRRPAPAATSVS